MCDQINVVFVSIKNIYGEPIHFGNPDFWTVVYYVLYVLSLTPSGAVLGRDGGAMKQMLIPFWLGLGGTLGSGRQPFPWIHVSDLAGIIAHALEPRESSPSTEPDVFNGVAPTLNTNFEFTKELGRVLKRPTIFPVPGFFLDVSLGSERAVILTQGQKVLPKRTLDSGFEFQYPDLTSALKEITGSQWLVHICAGSLMHTSVKYFLKYNVFILIKNIKN